MNIIWTKKDKIMKYIAFCGEIKQRLCSMSENVEPKYINELLGM